MEVWVSFSVQQKGEAKPRFEPQKPVKERMEKKEIRVTFN